MNLNFKSTKLLSAIIFSSFISVACSNIDSDNAQTDEVDAEKSVQEPSVVTKENEKKVMQDLQKNLSLSGIEAKITSASPTQIRGIYWVTAQGIPAFFTDIAGKHIFQGKIIEVGGDAPVDLSNKLNAKVAKKQLATLQKKDMIIYPAKGETKASIYIFTDPTCPYCQKIHNDIPKLNDLGIEVRYLAWPRDERGAVILESIWCHKDRNEAMNMAKSGQTLEQKTCDSPVKEQTELGFNIGVSGTPAVFTETGEQIGGYIAPAGIVEFLKLED